jgi:hypothetical protein
MVLAKATALEVGRFEFTHRSLGSRTLTLLFDAMPAPVETFSSLESEISLVHDPNRKLRSKLKEQFLAGPGLGWHKRRRLYNRACDDSRWQWRDPRLLPEQRRQLACRRRSNELQERRGSIKIDRPHLSAIRLATSKAYVLFGGLGVMARRPGYTLVL